MKHHLNPKLKEKYYKILDIASEMFFEKGFAKTNLVDIVQKTGGSLTTLYKIFHSKEELFETILRQQGEKFCKQLSSLPDIQGDDLEDALIQYGIQFYYFYNSEFSYKIFKLLIQEREAVSDILMKVINSQNTNRFVMDILKQNYPHFTEEDIQFYTNAFLALLRKDLFYILTNQQKPTKAEVHKKVEKIVYLFLFGISKKP
ncbi:hypothetical protein CCZ01_05385 [Helicobacter monodelphidis]|uniref:TetR/AcrR family transcriptional regulator n=1 Tax=Helicobacter sp. 15-1451 TaxID=2004995 RepID=UPI000DCBA667|nr:TetR/AcrR family transcriptional regulator [Helicobacter sp. 15-1451]RAX57577.1 hypothetical protein CCZ01_05385 [Helicobacter sp. 15-1451]